MKTFKYMTQFSRLPVNTRFSLNGTQFVKQSTRTGAIVKPIEYAKTWFYFGKNESVLIAQKDIANLAS